MPAFITHLMGAGSMLPGIKDLTHILAKDCLENEHSTGRQSDVMVNIGEEENSISSISNTNFDAPTKRPRVLQNASDASLNSNTSPNLRKTNWLNCRPVKTPPTVKRINQVDGRKGFRSERGAC